MKLSNHQPEDAFIRQDVMEFLDAVSRELAAWLHGKLLRHAGANWWESRVREILDEPEVERINHGEWKSIEDLDLNALLKVLRRSFRFLNPKERLGKEVRLWTEEMQHVRHRCIGHRSSRGNKLEELERDLDTTRRFCEALGLKADLARSASELRDRVAAERIKRGKAPSVPEVAERKAVGTTEEVPAAGGEVMQGEDPFCESVEALMECFPNKKLTASQKVAVSELEAFLRDPQQNCFILRGYAGTGKTFLLSGLVKYLKAQRRNPVLMAPTGRAAYVLSDKHNVQASTIHRAIYSLTGLKEYRELDESGDVTYKFYFETKNNDIDHDTVFIVDEASMVSDFYSEAEFLHFGSGRLLRDLLDYINFDANDYRKKLILVGDWAQLPPVHMSQCPALDPDYLRKYCGLDSRECELTDVVRQLESSPILRNATRIREILERGRFSSFDFEADGMKIIETSPSEFVERFVACHKESQTENVLVTYTNSSAASYNRAIRERLFPGAQGICAGDRVIIVRNNYSYEQTLLNGQMAIVTDASGKIESRRVFVNVGIDESGKRKNKQVTLRFMDVELKLRNERGEVKVLKCKIIEDCLEGNTADLPSEYSKALYVDFRERNPKLSPRDEVFKKELRADPYFNAVLIKYGYAITGHKSQGGEWKRVFVDFQDRNKLDRDSLRWSYTALTRAQEYVVATNALHRSILTPQRSPVQEEAKALQPEDGTLPADTKVKPETADLGNNSAVEEPRAVEFGGTPFQNAVIREVTQLLKNGWRIEDVKHTSFQEQYQLTDGSHKRMAKIFFNQKNKLTNVQVLPGKEPDIDETVLEMLKPLRGRTIRERDDLEESVNLDETHREFVSKLRGACVAGGINVVACETKTQYHLQCVLRLDSQDGTINFFFDRRGRFKSLERAGRVPDGLWRKLCEVLDGSGKR